MFVHHTKIRVSYSDTDQMGIVHHSNYMKYYETARWEAMREIGICYKELEKQGILMPVISMSSEFIKPAYYDELLTVKTIIRRFPNVGMKFEYELKNESGDLINKAETTLAFIKSESRKPCHPPEYCMVSFQKFILEKNIVV